MGSPSCEVTSLKSVPWNCLVASQYWTVRTTLGRTKEAFVTMPSTDTSREMKWAVSARGDTLQGFSQEDICQETKHKSSG